MKNKEKYAKEIVELACNGRNVAVCKSTGKPIDCVDIVCSKCSLAVGSCMKSRKEWAESEYIEPVKISKRDREFLDYIKNNFVYIARNENGKLFAYEAQPRKGKIYWKCTCGNCILLNRQLNIDFPMVKWEDTEPWLIEDLKMLKVVEEYN